MVMKGIIIGQIFLGQGIQVGQGKFEDTMKLGMLVSIDISSKTSPRFLILCVSFIKRNKNLNFMEIVCERIQMSQGETFLMPPLIMDIN